MWFVIVEGVEDGGDIPAIWPFAGESMITWLYATLQGFGMGKEGSRSWMVPSLGGTQLRIDEAN